MPDAKPAKLTDFQPDNHNANVHSERGHAQVTESVQRFGAGRSLLVDRNNRVIAGNLTQEVMAELGFEDAIVVDTDGKTPVIVRRVDIDLDSPEGRGLAIADNRTAEVSLQWSAEELAWAQDAGADLDLWWRENELEVLLADIEQREPPDDPGAQIDKANGLNEKWQVRSGDLWEIPSLAVPGKAHRILCGDSTRAEDVERLMGGEKAEMVWTDPPYGVAIGDKNKFLNKFKKNNRVEENLVNDRLDESALLVMLETAFDNAVSHCVAGGAWYVAAPPGPLHVLFGQALKDRGIWRQTIQWIKNNSTFSPMGVDYHWQAEPIFYGWLPNAGHRYYGGRKQTTVWNIDRPLASPEHPTMKPVELVARAVENSSQIGEITLDPFLGSGTTAVAAERTGRICYGMEIEPKYCAVGLERIAGLGLEPRRVS